MKLAIKGHSTRGKEVIELLEMLGGENKFDYHGEAIMYSYYVSSHTILNDRLSIIEDDDFVIFTLEEFEQKFPYKVGDKVISIYGKFSKISGLIWSKRDNEIKYELENDVDSLYYTSELQSYKEEIMEEINIHKIGFNGDKARLILPDGYEFKAEDNEVFVIKKKPKYPKTYEECARLLDTFCGSIEGYNGGKLLSYFQQLLVCRDAYWKIAGKQRGLDKSWKPKFGKYLLYSINFYLYKDSFELYKGEYNNSDNRILVFPTEEMRNAFYENFKDLIEQCKELL